MHYTAMPTEIVVALRNGMPDANGQPAERSVSNGSGNPCRHCLKNIPEGAEMLVCAYRPFDELQPYAETGPILLCADDCEKGGGEEVPQVLTTSPDYLIKGYGPNNRIVYGTGSVTPTARLDQGIDAIFDNPDIAYVHVRSSRNNCYLARVDRG